ncbi:MAG: pyruvate kinase, partial [Planctomycetia bacterium]
SVPTATTASARSSAVAVEAVAAGAARLSRYFVRTGHDLQRLREGLAAQAGPRAARLPVVAKVERVAALEHLDAILAASDGVIVARGDLGLDAGPERMPVLQRRILAAARRHGRPALVATEMLESMTQATRPTRAEASDVAGAVFGGADAVMLSAETAVGRHPALVVETMAAILREAEQDPDAPVFGHPALVAPQPQAGHPDQAVVRAGVALAREAGARAIAVYTRTGASALRISSERPTAPVYAFTPDAATCRRLALAWGVRAQVLAPQPAGPLGSDLLVERVREALRASDEVPSGSRVVALLGAPGDAAGTTSVVRLLTT